MTTASAQLPVSVAAQVGRRRWRVLPGFGLSLGYTMTYLSLLVLIPLGALVLKTATLSWGEFWSTVTDHFVIQAFKLTFAASFLAAVVNGVFGLLVAWVLVRYPFPGRRLFDALVDFPFALPTAVAGLTFANLYAGEGWYGRSGLGAATAGTFGWILNAVGVGGNDRSVGGVVIVLVFVGLPFIIRTVQPVLQGLDKDVEEAAASLGATRWYTFRRVIFPTLLPAWLSGLALAFARAVGEYGSVIFVAGNIPGQSQIAPLQIITKLDDYRYEQATAIAVVLLGASLMILLLINGIEWWSRRHEGQ